MKNKYLILLPVIFLISGFIFGHIYKHFRPWSFGDAFYSKLDYLFAETKNRDLIKQEPNKDTNFKTVLEGNSFDLKISSTEYNFDDRIASGYAIKKNGKFIFEIFTQQGFRIFGDELKKIKVPKYFTLGSGTGGIKTAFILEDQKFLLYTSHNFGCVSVKLYNLTKKKDVFEGDCLPDYSLIDYNGFGSSTISLEEEIIFSIGTPETSSQIIRNLAQNEKSVYGKILSFKKKDLLNDEPNFEIFSLGHRNPQGITKINDKIFSLEHGPRGGDEINLIKKGNNYGWPISSYGTRYYSENMKAKPFETSHKLFNFSEPLYSFIPSIGISGLGTCPKNNKKYYNEKLV